MKDFKKEHIKLKIEEIYHYENNNKIHTKKDIDEVIKSIKKNWYIAPICVDEENILLAWHGRTLALAKMWYKEVEVLKIHWLSEEQKKDYRIRDNTTALLADFNLENLKLELESLWDFSKDIIDHLDIDLWLNFFDNEKYQESIEDEVPTLEEDEIVVENWDIFQLWEHRLICGNSTNTELIDKLVDKEDIDISFTSPPYNLWKWWSKYKNYEDNLSDYLKLLIDYTDITLKYCKYSFNNIQFLSPNRIDVISYLNNYKHNLNDIIIWDKISWTPTDQANILKSSFEFIFIFSNNPNWRRIGLKKFVWSIDNIYRWSWNKHNDFADIHNATFPLHLPEFIINSFTKEWNSVLDLFWWTWTTLIACEKTWRKCYMSELDPFYVQTIIRRFHSVTNWKVSIKCLNRDFDFNFLEK